MSAKRMRGYFVLVDGLEQPGHWEAAWTGVFPRKRDAQKELQRMRREAPGGRLDYRLGTVTWEAN